MAKNITSLFGKIVVNLIKVVEEEVFKEISTDLGHPNKDGFARYLLKKTGYKIEKNKVIE